MKIVIDGDVIAYQACAKSPDDVDESVHQVEEILDDICLHLFVDRSSCDIFAYVKDSPDTNFRNNWKDYKATRTYHEKPAALDAVRAYIAQYGGYAYGGEADDYCIAKARELGECVVVTIDKDFKTHPGTYYNPVKRIIEHVTQEEADLFYHQQLIMGDSADNIKGIRGLGPAKSKKILQDVDDMAKTVAETWAERYPRSWKQRLEKCMNLIYIRDNLDDLKRLELPSEYSLD